MDSSSSVATTAVLGNSVPPSGVKMLPVAVSNSTAGLLSAPQRKQSSWAYDDVLQAASDSVTVCLVCGNGREEAVVLRCQHVFCHGCLTTRGRLLGELRCSTDSQQQQQHPPDASSATSGSSSHLSSQLSAVELSLSCPVCGERTPLASSATTDGVDGLTSVSLQGLRLDRKMSLVCEAAAQRCDVCCFRPTQRGPVDADYYCSRCAMNLCTQCKTAHDTQPVFRSHGIIHISNKESLRLYCERHARLHCLYFCQDCQLPACCACLLVEHPSHVTTKLREALTQRRDNLKTLLNELGPLLDKSEARLKRLAQQQQLIGFRNRTHSAGSGSAATTGVGSSAGLTPTTNGVIPTRHRSEALAPKVHLLLPSKSLDEGGVVASLNASMNGHHHPSLTMPEGGGGTGSMTKEVKESSLSFFKSLTKSSKKNQASSAAPVESIPLLDAVSFNNNNQNQNHLLTSSWDAGNGSSGSTGRKGRNNSEQQQGRVYRTSDDIGDSTGAGALSRKSQTGTTVSVQSDHSDKSTFYEAAVVEIKPLELYAEYFDDVRLVFQLANHMLQLSQSKRLLLLYDDITARLQMILKTDLRAITDQLQTRLDDLLANSESHHHQLQQHTSLNNSTGSLQNQDRSSFTDGSDEGDFMPDISCQTMLVRPKLCWKEEKFRNEVGDLWNPCDIAFFSDGDFVVAEYDTLNEKNNRLRMFASDGSYRGVIQQGAIKPLGVAVTREGNIAITDCNDKKVKIFSRSGELMTEIGKGQFGWPYGIAVNSRGQLIVTDAFNDTVSVYGLDGKRCHQLSKHLKNPYHVTVDNCDNIIVSDFGSSCLRIYDTVGQKIRTISEIQKKTVQNDSLVNGNRRSSKYKLRGPRGVCTDFRGNIIVADDCSRVCMFDSAGKYVRNLLTEEDFVKYPEAVATSNDGRLAVTEWNPNNMFAIKIFNLYE